MTRRSIDDVRRAEIGARIRMARARHGIGQVKLGHELGLSYQQINKYEQGRNVPNSIVVLELASLLDVRVGWLLGEDETSEAGPPIRYVKWERRLLGAFFRIGHDRQSLAALLTVEALASIEASHRSDLEGGANGEASVEGQWGHLLDGVSGRRGGSPSAASDERPWPIGRLFPGEPTLDSLENEPSNQPKRLGRIDSNERPA